jgi:hypothetical protein
VGQSGGLLQERDGKLVLAELDGGAHHGVAEVRDTPTSCAGDLGHEASQMQAFHEARDLATAPRGARRGGAEQPGPQIAVAKALEEVLAPEDGGEEGEVRERRGIERSRRAAVAIPHGLREALEGAIRQRGIVDDREGIEVTVSRAGVSPREYRHRNALFHLLVSQTSC